MKGVLEGIRILELGNFISGPYGAVLLADMGAEVIKVENPKGGDPFRGWDFGGDQPNFWAFNRGKKSVTLNLQTPEGKEIFYGLVKQADVVIENYRPGVTKKLGIDYESLRKINERIICCSITGTGPTGPYVNRPAYDTVGQGMGGMMSVLMDPKNPRPIGPAYADHLSGLYSAVGVLGALVARAKTGKGQQVDATMAGAVLGFLDGAGDRNSGPWAAPRPLHPSETVSDLCFLRLRRFALRHPSIVAAKILGRVVQFGRTSGIDRRSALQHAAEPPEKLRRAEQNLRGTFQRKAARLLDGATRSQRRAAHAGLQLGGSFPRSADQTHGPGDSNRSQKQADDQNCKFPVEYSDDKIQHPTPPPELGEHNGEFLKSLGYDEKAIAELKEKGVI